MFSEKGERLVLELLKRPQGLSTQELIYSLKMSRRTFYRILSEVTDDLKSWNLSIIQPKKGKYQLSGSFENLKALQHELEKQEDESNLPRQERQNYTLICLLSEEEVTLDQLMDQFFISEATAKQDVQTLKQLLKNYDLDIGFSSGKIVLKNPNEKIQRLLIASILNHMINDETFFRLIDNETDYLDKKGALFYQLFPDESLKTIYQLLNKQLNGLKTVRDFQKKLITIELTITACRLKKGKKLNDKEEIRDITEQQKQEATQLLKALNLPFSEQERNFLAQQLAGLNYKLKKKVLVENYKSAFLFQTGKFIFDVSTETGIEFSKDMRLYTDLVQHIDAAMRRSFNDFSDVDTISKPIQKKYEWLDEAVNFAWQEEFDNPLPKTEMFYIFLYFVDSYIRNYRNWYKVRSVLIAPSDIMNLEFLQAQLVRKIPELKEIEIIELSKVESLDFDNYDLILSTFPLEIPDKSVFLVTPLLMDDEIEKIRTFILQFESKVVRLNPLFDQMNGTELSFEDTLEHLHIEEKLYQSFRLIKIKKSIGIEKIIEEAIGKLSPDFFTNKKKVVDGILKRYFESPIGIPKSNIALFHYRGEEVKEFTFFAFDLEREVTVLSVDRHSLLAKRFFLLLAPKEGSRELISIFSEISELLIQNQYYTSFFENADEADLRHFLGNLLVENLRNFITKED